MGHMETHIESVVKKEIMEMGKSVSGKPMECACVGCLLGLIFVCWAGIRSSGEVCRLRLVGIDSLELSSLIRHRICLLGIWSGRR